MPEKDEKDEQVTSKSSNGARIQTHEVKLTKSAAEIMANPPKFPELRRPS